MNTENSRTDITQLIGKRIRTLRLARGLTQKELAGDTVSRNMLSMIESGTALPSTPTLLHIAEVLSVPVGFFFAPVGEELIYSRSEALASVYSLLGQNRYNDAAEISRSYADKDTELCRCLAVSELGIAVHLLGEFKLASASKHTSVAARAAAKLPADGARIVSVCSFIDLLSDSVSGNTVPDELLTNSEIPANIIAYLAAYKAIKSNDSACATGITRSGLLQKFHSLHIRGAILMSEGDHDGATRLFDLALSSEDGGFWSRYKLICDLELCRKTAGDFEAAYALSTSRMEMHGMFSN